MAEAPTVDDAEAQAEPNLAGLDNALGFLLRMAQLRAFDSFYSRLSHLGLRPGEFSVLWIIRNNPGIRQGTLARALSIKPAQMTLIVRRLETRGDVRREIPEEDRRSVILNLTEKGEGFVDAHYDAFLGADSYLEHELSGDEMDMLCRLLRRFSGIEETNA